MGLALWRSRSVPRWLAVLFVVGLEVAQQVQSKGSLVVLVHAAICGGDGPAGGPDLAGSRPPGQPRPGAGRRPRIAAFTGGPGQGQKGRSTKAFECPWRAAEASGNARTALGRSERIDRVRG